MKNILKTIVTIAALGVSVLVINAAPTTNVEVFTIPITSGYHGQTVTCTNLIFYGVAHMTNSSGTFNIIPPAGTTQGIFTDLSGYPPNYTSQQFALRRSDGHTFMGCGSVTFPATNGTSYTLTTTVTAPYPNNATNMVLTLQIVWQ